MNRQYSALSGVAILLIVLNHAIHFGFEVSPVEGAWLRTLIVLQALGAFAVPAFLFVSGAFLSYSAAQLSFRFIRGSLGRILWPYLIWSLVFYAVMFLVSGARDSLVGYAKSLVVGYPYHFVPLLIFWYVASPIVVRIARTHAVAVLAAIGLYQVCLLVIRFPEMFGAIQALPQWLGLLRPPVLFTSMSDWAIYFPLGLVVSMHDAAVRPYLVRVKVLAGASAAALFLLGILDAFDVLHAPWARFAAPVPLMFVLPVVVRDAIPFFQRFELLGRRSYGIYLAHFLVINLAVVAAMRLELRGAGWLLTVFPIFAALALGAPLLLMDLARTLPARVYRSLFGIAPPPVRLPPRVAGGTPLAARS